MKFKFDVQTLYSTIYLSSDNTEQSLRPEVLAVSKDEDNGRLIVVKNTLIITTGSYGHIRGDLFVLREKNQKIEYEKFDHIVEAGLDVYSGKLQILDCPTSTVQFEVEVQPGEYGVRIYSSGLRESDFSEMEGDDRYLIEIWPARNVKRKILKQYDGW